MEVKSWTKHGEIQELGIPTATASNDVETLETVTTRYRELVRLGISTDRAAQGAWCKSQWHMSKDQNNTRSPEQNLLAKCRI